MTRYHKWKRLLLLTTVIVTLGTILWSAYLFTAIWLRVRCARELAAQSEPLEPINLAPALSGNRETWAAGMVYPDSDGWGDVWVLLDSSSETDTIVERLEAVQRPGFRAIWKQLFGGGEASGSRSGDAAYSLLWAAPPSSRATVVRVFDPLESSNLAVIKEPQPASAVEIEVTPITPSMHILAGVKLWDPHPGSQVFSAMDVAGERTWIITRWRRTSPNDATAEPAAQQFSQELLLVDSSGRIYARLESPEGALLGKLPEPLGMGDQLVFVSPDGVRSIWVSQLRRSCAIGVIDRGQLRIVRKLQLASPRNIGWHSAEPIEVERDPADGIEEQR